MKQTVIISRYLYYSYIAILPLLCFVFFYLDKNLWNECVKIQHQYTIIGFSGEYLLRFFTFVSIFLSGILAHYYIQTTKIPANIYAILFMLFDGPFFVFIGNLDNSHFAMSEFLIANFTIENTGLLMALIYIIVRKKTSSDYNVETKHIASAVVLCILVLVSYYTVITFRFFLSQSLLFQIPFYFGFVTTVISHIALIEKRTRIEALSEATKEQKKMTKFASVVLVTIWILMIVAAVI